MIMSGEVTQRTGKFRSVDAAINEGVKFETRLKVMNTGGSVSENEGELQLNGVQSVTLYLVSNSSWYSRRLCSEKH